MHNILKTDGTQYSDKVQDFRDIMLSMHHTIPSTALLKSSSLNRWLISIVI